MKGKKKKIKRNKRIKQKGGSSLEIGLDSLIGAEEIYNFIFDSDFVNPNSLKLNISITETTKQFTNVGVIHTFCQDYNINKQQQTFRKHIFVFNYVNYVNYELKIIIILVGKTNTQIKSRMKKIYSIYLVLTMLNLKIDYLVINSNLI